MKKKKDKDKKEFTSRRKQVLRERKVFAPPHCTEVPNLKVQIYPVCVAIYI